MAKTLSDIRAIIERQAGVIEDDWLINVCNDAQAEFSLDINISDTATIALTTSALEYTLPDGLKIINRLWLQSDFDNGLDKEFTWSYRIYSGKIIFKQPWIQTDTMNVDFYRHMLYFTDVENEIDLDDRFASLYTAYGQREYYDMASVKERIGAPQAQKEWDKHNVRYLNIKQQVISYYSIQNEPVVIQERW
jgi:hypothetical protein